MVSAAKMGPGERAFDRATGELPSYRAERRRGVLAMAPLWTGVVPFGLTFGVIARQVGFSPSEAQLASLLIFAGSAQMAMVSLYEDGAGFVPIVLAALVLNLRHVLYGLSLRRDLPAGATRPPTPLLAFVLTDESYGVTVDDARRAEREARHPLRRTDAFLWGASLSLFLVYSLATLAGVALGALIPEAEEIGLDLVFPLSFLALFLPLIRTKPQAAAGLAAAGLALALGPFGGGAAVLGATIGGAALGATLDGRPARGRGAG